MYEIHFSLFLNPYRKIMLMGTAKIQNRNLREFFDKFVMCFGMTRFQKLYLLSKVLENDEKVFLLTIFGELLTFKLMRKIAK